MGSRIGSGFNWTHNTVYRGAITYTINSCLTVRAGYSYGRRPAADASANSISFGLMAPNPIRQVTAAVSYKPMHGRELHLAYGRYWRNFRGSVRDSGARRGGRESVTPHVVTLMVGWTRSWGR